MGSFPHSYVHRLVNEEPVVHGLVPRGEPQQENLESWPSLKMTLKKRDLPGPAFDIWSERSLRPKIFIRRQRSLL